MTSQRIVKRATELYDSIPSYFKATETGELCCDFDGLYDLCEAAIKAASGQGVVMPPSDKPRGAKYELEECYADNGQFSHCSIIDTSTGRVVGTDATEPEDATLRRHFSWVLEELNGIGECMEVETIKQQVAQLRGANTSLIAEWTVLQELLERAGFPEGDGGLMGQVDAIYTAHTTLRGLAEKLPVAGLPVEHSRSNDFIVLKAGEGWLAHTYNYWAKFATEDEAKAYVALLQYRATLPREGGAQGVGK